MNNKSEKLLKISQWISKYLLYSLPVIIGTVIWSSSKSNSGQELKGIPSVLWEVLGWHLIIWFLLLLYFIISLFVWRTFREKILTKLTFSQDRDERDEYISGRASKATFYSTLAALIILFFISGLNVHIYNRPKEEAINGKRGTISIGLGFKFINPEKKVNDTHDKNESLVQFYGIPFTQESILLFLIIYHIASYHFFSRRRSK